MKNQKIKQLKEILTGFCSSMILNSCNFYVQFIRFLTISTTFYRTHTKEEMLYVNAIKWFFTRFHFLLPLSF